LGLLKLDGTVLVAEIYSMELRVGMCFSVPHCHQNVLPPVLSGICTYYTCLYCFQICFDVSVMWRLPQPSLDISVFCSHPLQNYSRSVVLPQVFNCNCLHKCCLYFTPSLLCGLPLISDGSCSLRVFGIIICIKCIR